MAVQKMMRRSRQLGSAMVSVMLLLVALMTVGVLVVQSANRELSESGAVVARERATMSAHAALQLAGAMLRQQIAADPDNVELTLTTAFTGVLGLTKDCSTTDGDCIPTNGVDTNPTGFRARAVSNLSDCSGMPCMRPGAIVNLPTTSGGTPSRWVDRQLTELLPESDPEAIVSVWIRNNVAEVFNPTNANATTAELAWLNDGDRRVVLTASARVRTATVVVEQEVALAPLAGVQAWSLQTPDEGYGGGHNNDNASVSVCSDDYAAGIAP